MLSSPLTHVFAVQLELLLGTWLLSGLAPRSAWLSSMAFLLVLLGLSVAMGVAGQASCGCFGEYSVSPWWTAALDAGLILGLLLVHPPFRAPLLPARVARNVGKFAVVTSVMFVFVTDVFITTEGGPLSAFARLRGEELLVVPRIVDLGHGLNGDRKEFSVTVHNVGSRPLTILAGQRSCTCTTLTGLPRQVEPGSMTSLEIIVAFKGEVGKFQHSVEFSTDDAVQPKFLVWISGEVIAEATPSLVAE